MFWLVSAPFGSLTDFEGPYSHEKHPNHTYIPQAEEKPPTFGKSGEFWILPIGAYRWETGTENLKPPFNNHRQNMTVTEVLQNCRVEGNVVKLPEGQLDRKLYLEVSNKLQLIGGKWKGGKTAGFVFEQDPAELLAEISEGADRNLKKEYQFFETPAELADRLVELAEMENYHRVLEPSAGRGAIVNTIPSEVLDFMKNAAIVRLKQNQ